MDTFTVYRIYNIVDGGCYVGHTRDFKRRVAAHFSTLKSGTHINRRFQAACKQFGIEAFKAEALEANLTIEIVDSREVFWIAHFRESGDVYNNGNGGGYYLDGRSLEYQELTHQINRLLEKIHKTPYRKRGENTAIKKLRREIARLEGKRKKAR